MDLHTERTEAMERREKALLRQHDEMITRKARAILGSVGWGADREKLLTAVQEYDLIKPDIIDRVYLRAIELQSDPNETGRRVPPEELMAKRNNIEPAVRARVKQYVAERRRTDPKAMSETVREEAERRFRVVIEKPNWSATYWLPNKPGGNGSAPPVPTRAVPERVGGDVGGAASKDQRETAAHEPDNTLAPESSPEGEIEEEAAALYQIIPAAAGKVRVVCDVEVSAALGHSIMSAIAEVFADASLGPVVLAGSEAT